MDKQSLIKKMLTKYDIQYVRKIFLKTGVVKNFYRDSNGKWKPKNENK
jgi:hypothetical protein